MTPGLAEFLGVVVGLVAAAVLLLTPAVFLAWRLAVRGAFSLSVWLSGARVAWWVRVRSMKRLRFVDRTCARISGLVRQAAQAGLSAPLRPGPRALPSPCPPGRPRHQDRISSPGARCSESRGCICPGNFKEISRVNEAEAVTSARTERGAALITPFVASGYSSASNAVVVSGAQVPDPKGCPQAPSCGQGACAACTRGGCGQVASRRVVHIHVGKASCPHPGAKSQRACLS